MPGQRAVDRMKTPEVLDRPIYALAQASHIVNLHHSRVRRWLLGYTYSREDSKGQIRTRRQQPVVQRRATGDSPFASFLDVVDLLFVKAFLDRGHKLQQIREALNEARTILGTTHFARQDFFSDGRSIYLKVEKEGPDAMMALLEGGQWVIAPIILQLAEQIVFEDDTGYARQWYPLGKNGNVLVDPTLSFGKPIITGRRIDTRTIYECYKAEREDAQRVAEWFDIKPEEVNAAIAFEERAA